MLSKQQLGSLGEDISEIFLVKKGYSILKRNYRCRLGELDLIAKNKNKIVFIEVKTRTNLNFGYPEESVNNVKVLKLKKLAIFFAASENINNFDVQFDVISINLSETCFLNDIRNIKNISKICSNMKLSEIEKNFNLVHIQNAF
ncbi:MAG: YraN family protein [Actinobacteria bacterium]|nr:YraN family protein [Actinomycetota bacterium]